MKLLITLITLLSALYATDIQLAPDGTYVQGQPTITPNGTYVGSSNGQVQLTPNGTYVGVYTEPIPKEQQQPNPIKGTLK